MSSRSPNFLVPCSLTRRAWLGVTLLCGVQLTVGAAQAALPAAKSLPDELALALKGGGPLVVMVSLEGCPFCKTVRLNYLSPLRAHEGLIVVQVDMRSAAPVLDFNATALTHDKIVRAWAVTMAPTLLFFGPSGAEVAPRLVGVSSRDYYGAFLDARLAQARTGLSGKPGHTGPVKPSL
jgi:hypothetical protein